MSEKRKHIELDKLIKYLNEPLLNYNIDILIYWKVNIYYYIF